MRPHGWGSHNNDDKQSIYITNTAWSVVERLIARQAVTRSRQEVPAAVRLTQIARSTGIRRHWVDDADSLTLNNGRDLGPGGCLQERSQWRHHWRTRDVIHVDSQQRGACALVAEHKVNTASPTCAISKQTTTIHRRQTSDMAALNPLSILLTYLLTISLCLVTPSAAYATNHFSPSSSVFSPASIFFQSHLNLAVVGRKIIMPRPPRRRH